GWTSGFLLSIPGRILDTFIALFTMFFLLIEGESLVKQFWSIALFKEKHRDLIMKKLGEVSFAVVYGSIVVSLVQGVVAGIGYFIFGLKSPIVWGALTAVAALVPIVGTALVWVPVSVSHALLGLISQDMARFWNGLGLFVYSMIVVSNTDNLIKPKIIGSRSNVHPVVVLVGVIGGLKVFGILGFVLGPVVLALCVTIASVCLKERV
ncbi:AI-2E family transporter, partial [Candidatus Woesearchaeota archaeon]|nr:AI-2E family transporter [Candidatus Woesearchaeota archaeon]